jgi:hypothetical protein
MRIAPLDTDSSAAHAGRDSLKSPGQAVELAAWLFDARGGGESMKYVLLFCGSAEDAAAFEAMTPGELRARYAQVGAWFAEHRNKIGGSNQL